MGIYLNPGNENFKRIASSKLYVDKTQLIAIMNTLVQTADNYVCVSRPRRFGKTTANNMLAAYYSKGCDSRSLFAPFKIAQASSFVERLNKFNVLKIDVNSEYRNAPSKDKLISSLSSAIRKEFRSQFPTVGFEDEDSVATCIIKANAVSNEQFVILLDEYDVLVREQVPEKLQLHYLDFLNGLFKSDTVRPALALAYITGILPVVRDRVQSKLNNFDEYTILNAEKFSEFTGFTEQEVRELCETHGIDFSECKNWYDGYRMRWYDEQRQEFKSCDIYNPESVVKCMQTKSIESFWSKTSTYQVITDRLKENYKGIKDDVVRMIAGESVKVDTGMYLNTMTDFVVKDDVLTYLIHLGYLAYNKDDKTCRIPNKEVEKEWFRAVSILKNYSVTDKIIKSSEELLNQTLLKNCRAVEKALDKSHIHVASNRSYNNEDALMSAIYLAYIYAKNEYTVIKEMTTGKGFADVVFIPFYPGKPAMIIELKRNGSTESALSQIQAKEYYDSLEHYQGNLLFVGINYDEKSKKHQCEILEFKKE